MYSSSTMQRTKAKKIKLDPSLKTDDVKMFEAALESKIVGQPDAVNTMLSLYQCLLSNDLQQPERPVRVYLFAGGTGVGKTRLVEVVSELVLNKPKAYTKIDCAEYQASHEIAKLLGAPPGYLGHRETPAVLSQTNIDQHQCERMRYNFILFDEIEKASDTVHKLLLGILDKATAKLGNNESTNFERSVIFMTTNLSAEQIQQWITGRRGTIGFTDNVDAATGMDTSAKRAIKDYFAPEFMNRIDRTIVFKSLSEEHLATIAGLELVNVRHRLISALSNGLSSPYIEWTPGVIQFILEKGSFREYGAREIKRAVQTHITDQLTALMATRQIRSSDRIAISIQDDEVVFERDIRPEPTPENN